MNLLPGLRAMLLAACCTISAASAATVTIDGLITDFQGRAPLVHSTRTVHLDLSDIEDFAPGEPIQLTLSASAPLLWMGGFVMGEGFSLQHNVVLQLAVGTHSVLASYSLRIPETGFINSESSPTSSVVGFTSGPRPDDLTLVVPWDTDLSDVRVTLIENTATTGTGSLITPSSSVAFTGVAGSGAPAGAAPLLSVQTVPEPQALTLLASGIAVASLRRRRSG